MTRVTSLIIYSKLLYLSDEAHLHALKPTDNETKIHGRFLSENALKTKKGSLEYARRRGFL